MTCWRCNLHRHRTDTLGHHRDDILETFFMNLFHGGRLATMPPKLVNEEGDLFLYRPLAHVAEVDCEKFAQAMKYPIIPCDLCGSQDGFQNGVRRSHIENEIRHHCEYRTRRLVLAA